MEEAGPVFNWLQPRLDDQQRGDWGQAAERFETFLDFAQELPFVGHYVRGARRARHHFNRLTERFPRLGQSAFQKTDSFGRSRLPGVLDTRYPSISRSVIYGSGRNLPGFQRSWKKRKFLRRHARPSYQAFRKKFYPRSKKRFQRKTKGQRFQTRKSSKKSRWAKRS